MSDPKRDPIGEHPLFYRVGGSEVKVAGNIRDLVEDTDSFDEDAMAAFLYHQYTPGRDTVYKPIKKATPGWETHPRASDIMQPYWTLTENILDRDAHYFAGRLRDLLQNTVERMIDTHDNIAVFLSGGLDSSIIAALVVKAMRGRGRVHTFSIGFPSFSEQHHAKAVSDYLGTIHHEILVTPEMALECIPLLMKHAGEPIGDAATVCNYILAREVAKYAGIGVAFSGDGGDEVFAGYPWHWLATELRIPFNLPSPLKALGRGILEMVPGRDDIHSRGAWFTSKAGVFCQPTWWQTQAFMEKALTVPEIKRLTYLPTEGICRGLRVPKGMSNRVNQVQAFDILNILPEKFCMKAHWATSLAGVTELAPFLDPAVVELAFQMPPEMKLVGRTGKWILRKTFQDLIPAYILDRPKQGFGVPIAEWLKDKAFQRNMRKTMLTSEYAERYFNRYKVKDLLEQAFALGVRSYREANSIWTLYALAGWHTTCVA